MRCEIFPRRQRTDTAHKNQHLGKDRSQQESKSRTKRAFRSWLPPFSTATYLSTCTAQAHCVHHFASERCSDLLTANRRSVTGFGIKALSRVTALLKKTM